MTVSTQPDRFEFVNEMARLEAIGVSLHWIERLILGPFSDSLPGFKLNWFELDEPNQTKILDDLHWDSRRLEQWQDRKGHLGNSWKNKREGGGGGGGVHWLPHGERLFIVPAEASCHIVQCRAIYPPPPPPPLPPLRCCHLPQSPPFFSNDVAIDDVHPTWSDLIHSLDESKDAIHHRIHWNSFRLRRGRSTWIQSNA